MLCKIKGYTNFKIEDLRFLEIGTKIQENSQSLKLKYKTQHFKNAQWLAGQLVDKCHMADHLILQKEVIFV